MAKKDTEQPKGDSKCCPELQSWGIGEGRLPITTDPENPIKFFGTYAKDKDDDGDE